MDFCPEAIVFEVNEIISDHLYMKEIIIERKKNSKA